MVKYRKTCKDGKIRGESMESWSISEDKIIVMMTEIKETKGSTVYIDYIAMFDLTGDYDVGYELVIRI